MKDAVVIGAGPAGYTAALNISELGGSVVVVEKSNIGGCCTNYGCIPTKTLQATAELLCKMRNAGRMGINANYSLDFQKAMQRKEQVVTTMEKGVEQLLKNVEVIKGEAVIEEKNKVKVNGRIIEAKNIVIATGSEPNQLPDIKFSNSILSSTDILSLEELPEKLAVIGGGYIGVELAMIFNSFGSKVTVLEVEERILNGIDDEISEEITRIMKKKGIEVMTGIKIEKVEGNLIKTAEKEISCDKILLAVGRHPVISEDVKKLVKCTKKGITVNDAMQTNIKNIYAVGDVNGIMQLAHAAYDQAVTAAMNIMGKKRKASKLIPAVIFTMPEIAFVGKAEGKSGKYLFAANGKARAMNEPEGFVKVFAKNNKLVGARIIGAHASDLIAEAALAIKNGLTLEDIKETVHAHPTLSEAFKEAVENIK